MQTANSNIYATNAINSFPPSILTILLTMKLQIVCALLGVAMGGTCGYVGDEELEWWESDHRTLRKLWSRHHCDAVFEWERPIPTTETWMKMRHAYVDVVGSSKSTIGEPNEVDSCFVPIEVRESPGKGLGVFATEDIPRGQHICNVAIQRAQFESGHDYMKFLGSVEDPCDVLQYSYVIIFGDDKENQDNARICVELSDASIMNSIDFVNDPVDAGCLPEWNDRFLGGCEDNQYALRDIKKGDEILMDYSAFGYVSASWEWFGLADYYEEDDEEDPEWWGSDDWTLGKLWSRFDCNTVFESERPISTTETWMKMRHAYVDVVGSSKSTIGEPNEVDGFFAPIEVRQSPGKGRGVFATEDIPRGQHICNVAIQRAQFESGHDYKKFLHSISDDNVCDVLQYSYVTIFGDDKENQDNARICVELDDGSMMNSIDLDHDTVDAGCLPEWNERFHGGCEENDYALRDIKKGDEILVDYADSNFFTDGWKWFGLADYYEEDDVVEVQDDEELEWWESDDWTLGKLWSRFDCNTIFGSERQIPTTEAWMKMRQAYVDVVGSSKSTIGEPNEVDGFFTPVEVQQSPGKGRGVFATEDIPRGQHIWSGAIQRAQFESGVDYKKFLHSISDDDACDVLQHSFLTIFGDDKENQDNARICVELDDGSIINFIDLNHDPVDAGCLPEWNDRFRGGCDHNLYALRDIKKGDEILMNYEESIFITAGWEWFGLADNYEEDEDEEDEDEEDEDDDEEDVTPTVGEEFPSARDPFMTHSY
jgi:hypothetical protein